MVFVLSLRLWKDIVSSPSCHFYRCCFPKLLDNHNITNIDIVISSFHDAAPLRTFKKSTTIICRKDRHSWSFVLERWKCFGLFTFVKTRGIAKSRPQSRNSPHFSHDMAENDQVVAKHMVIGNTSYSGVISITSGEL